MMEMSNFSNVADLDRLINNIEYENQQYWKLIEKEGQQIAALEKDIEDNKRTIEIIQESVTQLDENTKRAHKQFTQNRDNCESLKKSCAILKDHEEALEKKLISVIDKGKQESSEREDIMNHYRNILLDYEARYKSFPLAKVLEEKNKEVAGLESQVMESESNIQQLKSKIQQFEEMDKEDYHIWNKFVIRIAEMKINTENLKKQELVLHQENKDINQRIDLARKKMLEEKTVQQTEEKEESMNDTEEGVNDDAPREVEADTSLNDINISIEQSDDEESTMISMYAGKEESPDNSRISQGNTSTTCVPEIPITSTHVQQSIKYPNISVPQRVKTGTGVQINDQVTDPRNDAICHISVSMNSVAISNTGNVNSYNSTHNPLHSTAVTQNRQQVPQVFRSVPRPITHQLVSSPQACFKSPSIPVMASPRPQTRLAVPNLTMPKMTRPDKRQVSIPPTNSSLRSLVNTTARYQQSIMSPQPYQPPVSTQSYQPPMSPQTYQPPMSPHVSAMQHKQQTVHSGRSFQINSNVTSMPNQNMTKPQISPSQPFIKPKDVQASPLLIPKSPRILPVNKKKSPPESPVVGHTLQSQVLSPISQIPHSRAMQPTSHIPVPKNRTSPSSIPVPIQHPKKLSAMQETSNIPHTSNNSIVIGTPQQKQIETPDVTPQTPSPDVAVPMDTSPIPSSSNAKTPEHHRISSPNENWSPFSMEKHYQKLTELKSSKSPGVHLYDKRPMFNHSDDGKTSNKEEDFGSFMTSFFKSPTDGQKSGDFMMGSGDATEMTLFGKGGTSNFFGGASGLTSPDAEKTSSSEKSTGFNFGSSPAENASLQSMFGSDRNSSGEAAEKETSFSFSFGGAGSTGGGSENMSSLTSLFGCSGGTNQNTGAEDTGFSFSFGGEGKVNSPQTHGFSLF